MTAIGLVPSDPSGNALTNGSIPSMRPIYASTSRRAEISRRRTCLHAPSHREQALSDTRRVDGECGIPALWWRTCDRVRLRSSPESTTACDRRCVGEEPQAVSRDPLPVLRHRYRPECVVRLTTGRIVLLEGKGDADEKDDAETTPARRWVEAVNTWGGLGTWTHGEVSSTSRFTRSTVRP